MPADNFIKSDTPGDDAFAITPSDTVNESRPFRGIIIGVAGTVALVTPQGNVVSLPAAMVAGVIHSLRGVRVNSTGTTATGLIGIV
jgi:hypothetical protein